MRSYFNDVVLHDQNLLMFPDMEAKILDQIPQPRRCTRDESPLIMVEIRETVATRWASLSSSEAKWSALLEEVEAGNKKVGGVS